MLDDLSYIIYGLFCAAVFLSLFLIRFSKLVSRKELIFLIVWSVVQCFIALTGFYNQVDSFPPHFLLAILPPFFLIGVVAYKKHKRGIEINRFLSLSTLLHTVRLPVEVTLFYLFQSAYLPELMTFEGRNFDIIAGITAPIVAILFQKKIISNKVLLIWNIVALFLVVFVLINGVLSARLPIQLFAFDQPTIAFEYAPFVLLPCLIVPLVIYTHLMDIILLTRKI